MKYIITESQYQTLLKERKYRSREETKKEREEYEKRFLEKQQEKLSEMQSLVNNIVSEYNSDSSLIILKCEIIDLLFHRYQSDVYLYFDIQYTGSDEQYTKQLKNNFNTIREPWRDTYTFLSFMRDKFYDHYLKTKESIGFNPQSCEYNVV